jgi:hypothetical protein
MATTYGSSKSGFSSGGFVWAGEITSSIVAPKAMMIGAMYEGCINYGQLPETDNATSSSLNSGFSLRSLIDISKIAETETKGQFIMRSAVVNNNIVNMAQDPEIAGTHAPSGSWTDDVEKELGAEIVTYVILQTAVMSLGVGSASDPSTNVPFTLVQ